MDISQLSRPELLNLQESIAKRLAEMTTEERAAARAEILAIAQRVGMSPAEIVGTIPATAKQSKPVEAKFRNPANSKDEWTGRGRQPKWVKDHVDGGGALDALRIVQPAGQEGAPA